MKRINIFFLLFVFSGGSAAELDAREIIKAAMDMMRGRTSYTEMSMVVHRLDWERTMSMQTWTEGIENSIVRVTAPAKDAGNGSLLKDNSMWSYAPKINRVIKVPSSMMNQSWMGSDLSNKDISKSTDIIDQYQHTLIDTIQQDSHTLYVIESIPNEDAAVVWGREVLTIRDDFILLEQQYWDQEGDLVKSFKSSEIKELGGRQVATVMRMQEVDQPNEWTEIRIVDVQFDVELAANIFTLSNLRNPRQ